MARIEPLPIQAYPKEMHTAMSSLRPIDSRHQPLTTQGRPKPRNLLGVLARLPALARAYFTFSGHLLHSTTLSTRQRELLVMRVAAVRRCESEWAQHVFLAEDAGLSDEEISRIAHGPDASLWSELEAAMLCAADELLLDGTISEPTWYVLSKELGDQQLLDLILTVGGYDTSAKVFEALQMETACTGNPDDERGWLVDRGVRDAVAECRRCESVARPHGSRSVVRFTTGNQINQHTAEDD